jgi:hypothetical protein
MASLVGEDGRFTLGVRNLVGRGPSCTVRLDAPAVSCEHAVLFWADGAWALRDLASTNGTHLDGQRLPSGERVTIEPGVRLTFGDPERVFLLERGGPPQARVLDRETGVWSVAKGGMLQLPDEAAPTHTLYVDEGQWVLEGEDLTQLVEDQQEVSLGARRFRLELPPPGAGHRPLETPTLPLVRSLEQRVETCSYYFQVSRDEEFVAFRVERLFGEPVSLPPRAFHYTLLELARQRLQDADLPEVERGWIYADELSRRLSTTKPKLNLDVCRARAQLADLGLHNAAGLVQRRRTTMQLRFGPPRVSVSSLGE